MAEAKKTTTTAKKAATATKKTTTTAKKTAGTSVKLTATEKKLVELYRAADADTKKAAVALLKGEKTQFSGLLDAILDSKAIKDTVSSLFKK